MKLMTSSWWDRENECPICGSPSLIRIKLRGGGKAAPFLEAACHMCGYDFAFIGLSLALFFSIGFLVGLWGVWVMIFLRLPSVILDLTIFLCLIIIISIAPLILILKIQYFHSLINYLIKEKAASLNHSGKTEDFWGNYFYNIDE